MKLLAILAVGITLAVTSGSTAAQAEKAPTNLKAVGVGPHSIKATWTPAVGVAAQTISASPFSATTNQRHGLNPTVAEYTFNGLTSGSYVIGAGSCQVALVEEACHEYFPGGIAEAIATTELPKGWYVDGNSLFERPNQEVTFRGEVHVEFPGSPTNHHVTCRLRGGGRLETGSFLGVKKSFLKVDDESMYFCGSDIPEEGASCGAGVHLQAFLTAHPNNRNEEDGGNVREMQVEEREGKPFLDFEENGKPSGGQWFVIQPCVGVNGTETKLTPNAESGKGNIQLQNRGGIPYVNGSVEVNDTVRNVPIEWSFSMVALETGAEATKRAAFEH